MPALTVAVAAGDGLPAGPVFPAGPQAETTISPTRSSRFTTIRTAGVGNRYDGNRRLCEGDGWANWSGLATLLSSLGPALSGRPGDVYWAKSMLAMEAGGRRSGCLQTHCRGGSSLAVIARDQH